LAWSKRKDKGIGGYSKDRKGDGKMGRLDKNSQKLSARFSLTKNPFLDMKKLGWGSI